MSIIQMVLLGWPLTFLRQGQICGPMHLYGEDIKKSFSESLLLGFTTNGMSSNIPSAPAYGVYVSQLIRDARACSNYQDFMERGKVLTTKLLSQGYQKTNLVATLKKFYGRHHDLVNPYNMAVSRIVWCFFANDAP